MQLIPTASTVITQRLAHLYATGADEASFHSEGASPTEIEDMETRLPELTMPVSVGGASPTETEKIWKPASQRPSCEGPYKHKSWQTLAPAWGASPTSADKN